MCGFTGLGLYLLFSITLAAAVALSTTKWPLALKSQNLKGVGVWSLTILKCLYSKVSYFMLKDS